MSLSSYLEERLEARGIGVDEFRELLVRLMNYGVLCRAESIIERDLYDRYLRCEEAVREYLDLIGVGLHHDRRFEYVRLYPPGSRVPGMEGAEEQSFAGSLRARLGQNEVALLLVLRAQYEKALREGKVDENGYVAESMESLGIAMKNLLGRGLPDKLTERKRLFLRLRMLRLVDYKQEEDLERGEAWLRIHPMIVEFVSPEALTALSEEIEERDLNAKDAKEDAKDAKETDDE
jgi:hypothetical protein